jgi:hypothetical protein
MLIIPALGNVRRTVSSRPAGLYETLLQNTKNLFLE